MNKNNRASLKLRMAAKDTEALLAIWKANDCNEWQPLVFEIVKELLEERNVPIPPQKSPLPSPMQTEKKVTMSPSMRKFLAFAAAGGAWVVSSLVTGALTGGPTGFSETTARVLPFVFAFFAYGAVASSGGSRPKILGKSMPDITLHKHGCSESENIRMALGQRLTVVYLWSSLNSPLEETHLALLQEVYGEYQSFGLNALAIKVRTTPDDNAIKPLIQKLNLSLAVFTDEKNSFEEYFQFVYMPKWLIFDGKGLLINCNLDWPSQPTKKKVVRIIDKVLSQG